MNKQQTIAPSLNLAIVQAEIIGPLLQLAEDPIPNIRFNVAKSLEVLAITYGNTAEGREFVRQSIIPALEQQKTDPDADVRYFAARAFQKAQPVDMLGECSEPKNICGTDLLEQVD